MLLFVEEADEPVAQLSNLDNLQSYRAHTLYQSQGTRTDGTAVNDSVTVELAYVNDAGVDTRCMSMQLESAETAEGRGVPRYSSSIRSAQICTCTPVRIRAGYASPTTNPPSIF